MPARRCAFSQTRVYEKPEHEFVRRCVTEASAFSESVLESFFSISCLAMSFESLENGLPYSAIVPVPVSGLSLIPWTAFDLILDNRFVILVGLVRGCIAGWGQLFHFGVPVWPRRRWTGGARRLSVELARW